MDLNRLNSAPIINGHHIISSFQLQPDSCPPLVIPENAAVPRQSDRASGCLSELSIPLVLDEEYFAALKNFAEAYSDYQSYLAQSVPRMIDCATDVGVDDYGLHDNDAERSFASVSDDEIESCGYLGWLRH